MTMAEARRQAGLTQEQLAEAVDSSAAYISQLESGFRQPSLGLLKRLSGVLNCSPMDLIEQEEEK